MPRRYPITTILIRSVLIVVVAAALFVSAVDRFERRFDAAAVRDLQRSGDLDAAALAAVRHESDPTWQRIVLAQSLVARVLQTGNDEAGGSSSRQLMLRAADAPAMLATAGDLARRVAASRPVVWQAWMLDGASTYLLWSLHGDPRLFTDRQRWENPLLHATALAPGVDEPQRFLAAAYLEIWPALGDRGRQAATDVVATAFRDGPTLERLIEPWLERNPDRDRALAVLPDRSTAWHCAERAFRRRHDLAGAVEARRQWYAALDNEIPERLDVLESRLSAGDPRGAGREALAVVASAPALRRYALWVSRALEQLPPGTATAAYAGPFERWLDLALDAYIRGLPGLSQAALQRLIGSLNGLPPPRRALAELAAGRDAAAARIAAAAEDLNTERWMPFTLGRARRMLEQGDPVAAAQLLDDVHPAWDHHPLVRLLRSAPTHALDRPIVQARAGERWPATAWRWRDGVPELDLPAIGPGAQLVVHVDQAPAGGDMVELLVDLDLAWLGIVKPDSEVVAPVAEHGARHLRLVTVAGSVVRPGEVRLVMPTAGDTI